MSSTFDDLSQVLTSEEKKNLLGQIQASLNLSARDTDSIVSKAQPPEELKDRLTKELAKLGFLDRLAVRIAAFFSNRSDYEVMGERKLLPVKNALRDDAPDLVQWAHQEWSPEFAKVLYDLFAEAQGLKPVFDHLFGQKLTLEAGLLRLIEEEYPSAIHNLEDLFPGVQIAELYKADQRRAPLQAELDRRLAAYLAQVPPAPLDRAKARLTTLYYLKALVQFPYAFLLDLFGHNPDKSEISKYPYFTGAPWRKPAGLFERLYYGLHLCSRADWHEGDLDTLFQAVADRISDEKAVWTAEAINGKLSSLIRLGQDVAGRVPWKDVLRWSFQDPYYGVKYVLPRFSLRDFYRGSLEMRLREELDERIPVIRQQLLAEERTLLFANGAFQPLEFYVPGVGASLASAHKVKGFQYPESLNLLWGFLSLHFQRKIQPFHQSLVRMIPPGSKSALQGLSNAVEELSSLRLRIHQFDRSLHPDSEEGKDFQKLKYELGTKALSLKPFQQMVQNKDAQALEHLNRGLEGLQILQGQLAGVRDRNVPALRTLLQLPYLLEGQQETIENGLDRLLVIVQKSLFVLKEAYSLES